MNRNFFIIIAVCLGIVAIMLAGNIIIIGDKLGQLTHVYIEYAFYVFILILAFIYLVRPVIKVHRAPEFPVLSADKTWNAEQLNDFAKRLAANCDYIPDKKLREEHHRRLLKEISFHSADIEPLRIIISKEINLRMEGCEEMKVLGINNRIKDWGKTVFMITAISQNNKFDTIAVLVMNYKLIADIVLASGFRPTKAQMFKLYVKVLTTALITYCTSQVFTDIDGVAPFDFGESMPSESIDTEIDVGTDMDMEIDSNANMFEKIINSLRKIQIPGVVIGSMIDGCVNAMMTLRIGYVTKSYLIEGSQALSGTKNKRYIKKQAFKESFKSMPSVIMSGSAVISKKIANALNEVFRGEAI